MPRTGTLFLLIRAPAGSGELVVSLLGRLANSDLSDGAVGRWALGRKRPRDSVKRDAVRLRRLRPSPLWRQTKVAASTAETSSLSLYAASFAPLFRYCARGRGPAIHK